MWDAANADGRGTVTQVITVAGRADRFWDIELEGQGGAAACVGEEPA